MVRNNSLLSSLFSGLYLHHRYMTSNCQDVSLSWSGRPGTTSYEVREGTPISWKISLRTIIDVFYMECCLPFKEQAPGTLHKFLLFWLNIRRRGKTFWCSSEGSTHTSNVSINGKAASPRNNKKYKHGSWLQECHSVESHWLREAPQNRAAGEPQHLPSASSDGPFGSRWGTSELRDSRDSENTSCHALLVPTPKIES